MMMTQAMVFAAGKGVRMMPLTANRPKPMLNVLGKPLLGHALDGIAAAGITQVVVNAHHCPDAIAQFIPPHVKLSQEATLLETGGAVRKALDDGLLDASQPFLAVNADILCTSGSRPPIERLQDKWSELGDKVDVLLLLVPKAQAWGHDGPKADYIMNPAGQLERLSSPAADYVYASLQIVRPQLYDNYASGARFSNLEIFDAAQKAGRLYGLVHDGGWYHFSTPQSLDLFHRQVAPQLQPVP